MLIVTDNAKKLLEKSLLASTNDPNLGARLTVRVVLDRERPGDHVVEYKGAKVLPVGQEWAQPFERFTLDTEDTPEGTKLVISEGKKSIESSSRLIMQNGF